MHSALRPTALRCEYLVNPLGIDVTEPRLSWALEGDGHNRRQTAYQIRVASSRAALQSGAVVDWDSGRVESEQTLDIRYRGRPLKSFERVWWVACSWDEQGEAARSEPAFWEAGVLDRNDWLGEWIAGPIAPDGGVPAPGSDVALEDIGWLRTSIGSSPVQYLRKEFRLNRRVRRARVYATARGLYRLLINGKAADERVFAPGWTDYHKRIEYQSYDVTDLLTSEDNVLSVILAEGWYAGYVGFTPRSRGAHYGNRPYFLGQLLIEFSDGDSITVASDASWSAALGPVIYSDLLMGEHYDARRKLNAWHAPGHSGESCYPVTVDRDRGAALIAERAQAMKIVDEIGAKTVTATSAGSYVFDLGQNMVGRVRLQIEGAAGTTISIRHAEALQGDGSLYTENLRSAKAEDIYTCSGEGIETYEPTFTYHGFRYVELSGLNEPPDITAVTGQVLSSATPRTGEFHCSSPLVNQLYNNILWSQRGNFISVPTDCPQRDERLGWLGDAQIFAATAMYNCDVAAFFTKWMFDVQDAQLPDGAFTDVAPLIMFENAGAPGWAEAGIIIPWTMYLHYGDRAIIRRHWDAMESWMDYVARHNPEGVRRRALNLNFGDWLSLTANTPKDLVATAFYAHSAHLMSKMASAIGLPNEEAQYAKLHETITKAFVREYVSGDGVLAGDTQTAYVLALAFDLLPECLRSKAAERLVADIEGRGGRLTTGFLGTKWLAPVLSRFGYADVASRLLLSEAFPSWGFCIKHGATTIWERWDSWTPENGFQKAMNSFNHYSLGSIGEWLYGYLGGIRPDPEHPGFKHFLIAPQFEEGIDSCDIALRSRFGQIRVAWDKTESQLVLKTIIPPNTSATISLPLAAGDMITENDLPLSAANGVLQVREAGGRINIDVGSGEYCLKTSTSDSGPDKIL